MLAGRRLRQPEQIILDVRVGFDSRLAEFNGKPSHFRLLVNFPPKIALPRLVNSLKGVLSGSNFARSAGGAHRSLSHASTSSSKLSVPG